MITKTSTKDERPDVFEYLEKKKFQRVIDVGGAQFPWAYKYATAYLDIQNLPGAKVFRGDINDPDGWEEVLDDVEENGKFDFSICSQTLEDLRNPPFVLKQLPKISSEGFISVPSKHWELFRIQKTLEPEQISCDIKSTWKGHAHHRWIFTIKDGVLWLFPKLNFIEYIDEGFCWVQGRDVFCEMSFWWKDDIPFKIVNDDYLGPNPETILMLYRNFLEDGI